MPDRREFLRLTALAAAGIACTRSTSPTADPSPTPTPTPTGTAPPASPTPEPQLRWRRIDASGPTPRREHTLTGSGSRAYLFGGRVDGEPLGDLWLFDRETDEWRRVDASGGPSPRFGHNAEVIDDETLIVFGGQAGGDLFNDTYAFDLERESWRRLDAGGAVPGIRYGAGSVEYRQGLFVSHGFNFQGRFDDTRSLSTRGDPRWRNRTPDGPRPVRRCLHRCARIADQMLLFGGQTDGRPFLGDTWLYDLEGERWQRRGGRSPSARNLYALIGALRSAWLFGGLAADGRTNDLWAFEAGRGWRRRRPGGTAPPARDGVEGALLIVPPTFRMLVFGGTDGERELDDLWELELDNVRTADTG